MTATPPSKITLPPRPTATDLLADSALSTDTPSPTIQRGGVGISSSHNLNSPNQSPTVARSGGSTLPRSNQPRRRSVRHSFASYGRGGRRLSRGVNGTPGLDDIHDGLIDDEELTPKLPSLVPGIRPAYSTPLPVLPMIVMCIAMLSELLSANLCTPFLLKMVEGFFIASGKEKNSETEAAVGLWTGNLVSVFFITQFFTSLLWSSIADRHGRRAVLVASLLGSAVALTIFGTSESLPEAICVRLIQGIFGGAVGVFRGSIRDLTDDTNAARAYAVLGFSWGFGGVIGPIIGGVFESPVDNFPGTFLSKIGLFRDFPYVLPTLIASVILTIGAVLSCFLSWDGGVRGGSRIALPVEKNEPLAPASPTATERAVSPVPSSRTAIRVPSLHMKRSGILSPMSPGETEAASHGAGYPALSSTPHNRRDSRASLGTAYGYGGIRSKHPTLAARAAMEAARRASAAVQRLDDEEEEEHEEGGNKALGLAQKLLLANEENTFNINDLWVSAAVAQDTAVFEDEDETEDELAEENETFDETPQPSPGLTPGSTQDDPRGGLGIRRPSGRQRVISGASSLFRTLPGHRLSVSHGGRRFSTSSGHMPAIFSNTGVRTPPAVAAAYEGESPTVEGGDPFFPAPAERRGTQQQHAGGLSVITEGQSSTASVPVSPGTQVVSEKQPSSFSLLPFQMILQYGLVALHGTIHDQVFLSFLVTPYRSGGLGLNPAHFSFLVALMCCCQLVYQFYLYPRFGPPLGRFNHLQMFRIGSALYLPAYFALPILHKIASPDSEGGFMLMTGLTAITAIRYCASTFAYTSVMVLINAMSPPHVVGLANGLAQSTVSASRFFGPIIGGLVWSTSIAGNPSGYAYGFYFCTAACFIQLSLSFFIR
ncbi:hypothetical protein I317_04821 [Kwoniella heveanensis CBS 569]|nr:hypothetical protein I317_04821 [Kwoniella heveanensis CBS 569]